jgi:hypothetical protein
VVAGDARSVWHPSEKRFTTRIAASAELHATTLPRASTLAHATVAELGGSAVMRDDLLRAHFGTDGTFRRTSSKKFSNIVT